MFNFSSPRSLARPLAVFSLGAAVLTGCSSEPYGPYETGLNVVSQSTEERVTRSYLIRDGDDEPMERKGTLSFGDDCAEARGSIGTRTITETGTKTVAWNVIGQTESNHPLVPGAAQYGTAGVSVVESNESFEGHASVHETYRDPNGSVPSYEETTESDIALSNAAAYRGISADEYVVGLSSLGDLWSDLDNADAELNVDLITRHQAQAGDIWSSLDGEMLYVADTTEEIAVAGEKVQGLRVDVMAVGDPDPAAGNLVNKCIGEAVASYVTDHPDLPNSAITSANLDVACDGAFTHQEVGTEWWVGNILVQASKDTYEVNIASYGYEWFEDDSFGCSRFTSPTRDRDDATLFIEYDVTTVHSEVTTSRFEVVQAEAS